MEIRWLSRFFIALCGLFLVIAIFSRVLFSEWDIPGIFFLISSFVFLTLSILFNRQGFIKLLCAKTTRRGMSVGSVLVVLAILLVGINYAATFLPGRIDFTSEKNHTLSDQSKKIISEFKAPVEFLYLQIPDENSKGADETIRLSLQKYIDENPHFRMTKYNLMEHPALAKKYHLNDQEQALIATYQGRHERFYKTDENSVTQALLRLLKGRKTIYFSVGHGELSLENTNPRGISSLKKEVERLFYEILEINLEKEVLPENAAALVIFAPEKTLSPEFKNKVQTYFEKGGRVFIAFDPVQNPDENRFLAGFGLQMSSGVVHQEQNALANVGSFVVSGWVPENSNHLITKSMGNNSPVMFYVTGSISELLPHSHTITPLIVSPQSTVLRKGFTKQDREIGRGSYVLVSAVENANKGLLIVSADSDIFANQFLYQQMNPTFMFNVFGFLTRDEDVVKLPDATKVAKDFLVTDVNFKLYIGLFAIPLPLFFLVMSNFWWFRRRWL